MSAPQPSRTEAARLIQQAVSHHRSGRPDLSVGIYKRILPAIAREPEALRLYAFALNDVGDVPGAIGVLGKAVKLSPMNPQLRVDLARILTSAARYDEAIAEADRSLAMRKDFTQGVHAKVVAMRRAGRASQAYAWLLGQIAGGRAMDSWIVDALAELAGEAGDPGPIIEALRRTLATPIAADERVPLLYKLGSLLDRAGQADEAFAAIAEASSLKGHAFDSAAHTEHVRALMAGWEGPVRSVGANERFSPVFIVGMPRSGTSLIEQILAAHPGVRAAGETDEVGAAARELGLARRPHGYVFSLESKSEPDLIGCSERMMAGIAKAAGGSTAQTLTEKLPGNIAQVGFLASLFPRARFIHCVRDYRDTILSCYFQSFAGALAYTDSVTACAHYAADTHELGRCWSGLFPDRYRFMRYNEVVGDLESQVRGLLGFLGLPFDEACLRYHESDRKVRTSSFEQATRPIYTTSIERWRPYARHLEPAVNVLRERGVPLEG